MRKISFVLLVSVFALLSPFATNWDSNESKYAYYEESNEIEIEEKDETILNTSNLIAVGNFDEKIETLNTLKVTEPVVVEPEVKYYKVNTYALNKRKTPDMKHTPVGYLSKGEPVEGVETLDNGWVELSDEAFVNGRYLTEVEMTEDEFNKAKEEFKAKKLKAVEESKKVAVASVTDYKKDIVTSNESTSRFGVSLPDYEKDLMARLVRAEAGGESYEGMVAVASVVLNRVADPRFPNSVEGVIYAKNQFSPVANGSINKPASDIHFKAVEDALTRDNTNGAVFFYAPGLVDSPYMESLQTVAVIGAHHFKVN